MKKLLTIIALFAAGYSVQAQDLVYKPKNPAFGGDTFNYNWLLSSAQAQDNTNTARTTTPSSSSATDLENFQNSLNRQILSQLARQVVSNQFGEDGLQTGSYEIGSYKIDVVPNSEGIIITILDTVAGEQTQVIVPYL